MEKMKAVVYERYGEPEVMELKEVEKPTPKAGEVLVHVRATTLNRTDCGFRKPEYGFIIRPIHGFFKPRKKVLGTEFAGEVEAVGAGVASFKPGDQVFGLSTYTFGAHAEYLCMPENGSITHKPTNMSYQEAAAVCDGLMLGMNLIRSIDFTKAKKILINGASGSIGTACVQLAVHYGAEVTAVCAPQSMELVRSLGAKEVLDYTKQDFTENGQVYDVVIDAVGKSSFFKCRKLLKPSGTYFSTELGYLLQNVFLALLTPLLGGKKVLFPIPKDSKKDMELFRELIEAGSYKAVIDRTYPLEQIVEAATYVETGQKIGNVVLVVG